MVRITVQGKQEATACYKIREQLFKDGYASCHLPNMLDTKGKSQTTFTKMPVSGCTFNIAHSLLYTGSMQESKTEHSMHGGHPLYSTCLLLNLMLKRVEHFWFGYCFFHGGSPQQTFRATLSARTNMRGCDRHQPVNVHVCGLNQHDPSAPAFQLTKSLSFASHYGHPSMGNSHSTHKPS